MEYVDLMQKEKPSTSSVRICTETLRADQSHKGQWRRSMDLHSYEDCETSLVQILMIEDGQNRPQHRPILRQDIEEIRTQTQSVETTCEARQVKFHVVLETNKGTRHWTNQPQDHRSRQRFFEWFIDQLPFIPGRPPGSGARAVLASRKVMANAWTVLISSHPAIRPMTILVRLLHSGDYHATLYIQHVEPTQSVRNVHRRVVGNEGDIQDRNFQLAAQIHDISVVADHYTNFFQGLVLDVQELETCSQGSGGQTTEQDSCQETDSSQEDEEDITYLMQRDFGEAESAEIPSYPTTLATLSMQASSLNSGPPPIRIEQSHSVTSRRGSTKDT